MHVPSRSLLLAAAGVSFLLYPTLRGFGPETGAAGADHFGSQTWVAAHVLAMVGFVALALAARTVAGDARGRRTELISWLAAASLLPYYGAESFGLHALGSWVRESGTVGALAVADDFRYAPVAMTTFAIGWVLLGWVGARWIRDAAGVSGWFAVPAGIGLLTFLPQFFTPGPVRIAHGALLAVALVGWAVTSGRQGTDRIASGRRPAAAAGAVAR